MTEEQIRADERQKIVDVIDSVLLRFDLKGEPGARPFQEEVNSIMVDTIKTIRDHIVSGEIHKN